MLFNRRYFIYTCVLFIIEVLIALYVKDAFIRPYVGDILVVMLVYYFFRAFFKVKVWPTAIGVLFFAFLVEYLQYLDFVNWIGLGQYRFFRIVLGTSYAWEDLLCYFIGFLLVLLLERKELRTRRRIRKGID